MSKRAQTTQGDSYYQEVEERYSLEEKRQQMQENNDTDGQN